MMPFPPELLHELTSLFQDRLSVNPGIRAQHGGGESFHSSHPPDAVAFAESAQEVSAAVIACARHGVPVIPFGAGTSLEGHVAAVSGGLCLDLSRMNSILEVRPGDMDVTVQAGVTRVQLNDYLRDQGLFFPVDPGATATLGGMAATRASGTTTVRYGSMRENVIALEAVMADGRIIRTANRARKSAAGYDLTRLLLGSEGTLGIITRLTLRLHPIPETITAAVCAFPSVEAAVNTVIDTLQSAVAIARVEFVDPNAMAAIRAYAHLEDPAVPTLFFEFHGSAATVAEQVELVQALAADHGGDHFRWATTPEDRNKLWAARHQALYALVAQTPNAKMWATDVCVPVSRLAENLLAAAEAVEQAAITASILGHVGDGNFHVTLMVRPGNEDDLAVAERLNAGIVARALESEGTCTGEHGIGLGKKAYLRAELGEAVDIMRLIKLALDPKGILNPGKIFE